MSIRIPDRRLALAVVAVFFSLRVVAAEDTKPATEEAPPRITAEEREISELTKQALESIVVITFADRNGARAGLGAGFVVDADGLIATNLHVIGEARPITVRLNDGRTFPVQEIHASDVHLDLAVLRIDATGLPPLELGDSSKTEQGQALIALGNPQGLDYSVVSGILSSRRKIDEREMLQVAMPIEPGNSGGPLLDRQGRVVGVITLKSLVTENLGFAVPIDQLKPLLANPNPVPMKRWLTIGVLNPRNWETLFGASWHQRAGRIRVEGAGQGFGGRSLALFRKPVPELPYEIQVSVKLDDEAGAAGLVFGSDGNNKHYGFYPSAGELRFSRFDGPDVYSWQVIHQIASPAYRKQEWNTLKLRIEADRVTGFVNGTKIFEEPDVKIAGQAGLAKFRDTKADFKNFQVGHDLPSDIPSPEVAKQIEEKLEELDFSQLQGAEVAENLAEIPRSRYVLEERARQMEREVARLRALAEDVHATSVLSEFEKALAVGEDQIDLLTAALLIARLDNPDLEISPYREEIDRMAGEIRETFDEEAAPAERLEALDKYLFEELGYHGSRHNYYNRSNSYLNEVIDDREGLPITLSVIYMELGHRLDLPIVGVGVPTHFMVRYEPEDGESELIDPFGKGKRMTQEEAETFIVENTRRPYEEQDLASVTKRQILERMLSNLLSLARDREEFDRMRHYSAALMLVNPDEERYLWYRAVLNYQTERYADAARDAEELLNRPDLALDRQPILELQRAIDSRRESP